jgi:methionyl-tRNA synthetase
MPFSAEKLNKMLNISLSKWDKAGQADIISSGHVLNQPELLFDKIEDELIQQQVDKLLLTKKANEAANVVAAPSKPVIEFDDFGKIDLRIGTIIAAEKVAKTKKLLKLTIDTGIDKRTVVSGIAEHYEPENIIGQQVTILVNLAPRNLKGIDSEGMILMAENNDGSLCFVSPLKQFNNGSEVK